VEGIHRSPVAAAGENLLAVDDEAEATRIFGRVGGREVEFHGADTDAATVDVERVARLVHQFHLGVVERRFTVTAGPPEIDVLQPEQMTRRMRRHLGAVHGHLLAVAAQRKFRRDLAVLQGRGQCDRIV
jgi:hypothetical protein